MEINCLYYTLTNVLINNIARLFILKFETCVIIRILPCVLKRK